MAMASLSNACRPMLRAPRVIPAATAGPHRYPGTRVHGAACAGWSLGPGSRASCRCSCAIGCVLCALSLWRSVAWACCQHWTGVGPNGTSDGDKNSNTSSGSSDGCSCSSSGSSGGNDNNSSSSNNSILQAPGSVMAFTEKVAERSLDRTAGRWRTLKVTEDRLITMLTNAVTLLCGAALLVVVYVAVHTPDTLRAESLAKYFQSAFKLDGAQVWGKISSYGAGLASLLPVIREYGTTMHQLELDAYHILHTYTPAAINLIEQLSGYAVKPPSAVEGTASSMTAKDSSAGNHASLSRFIAGLVKGSVISGILVVIYALIGGRLLI